MKYLCDQMLGTLAKWLRIYGFDTFYANSEMDDNELIKTSKNEKRVLITRDKNLLQVARKEKLKVIEINTTDINEQIKKVLNKRKVDKSKILSRCILCNTTIEEIKKEKVEKRSQKEFFCQMKDFGFAQNVKNFIGKALTMKI